MRAHARFRSRGFTFTELVFSILIGGVVISSCTGLYFAVGQRINTDSPRSLVVTQATMLADEIEYAARNAVSVSIATVGTHQRVEFQVPAVGTDIDSDTIMDYVTPGTIAPDGKPNYVSGTPYQLVDFYWSDSNGAAYTVSGSSPNYTYTWTDGSYLWRGKGNTGTPLASGGSGIDSKWSWNSDRARFNLISGVTYTFDPTSRVLTYTITASTRTVTDTQPSATELADNQRSYTVTRSVHLRFQPR